MRRKGFTLIELLIVVAIIAILAAIAVPNFLEAQTRSKVARIKSDMRSTAGALETYRIDNNAYPFPSFENSTNGDIDSTFDITNKAMGIISNTNNLGLTTPIAHITTLPKDLFSPNGSHWFGYIAWKDRWLLTSYGPDQDAPAVWTSGEMGDIKEEPDFPEKLYKSKVLLRKTYDASNGTVSNGDIWRSNMGSLD